MKPIAIALDTELRRVAREEDIQLEVLVSEVASLIDKTPRMLYNYRSGKWLLPSELIPVLCERFKSHVLFHALNDEVKAIADKVNNTPIELPENIEFSQLSIKYLKQVCDHHYAIIEALESEDFDLNLLDQLSEQTERVIQNERHLITLVEKKYEQQIGRKRKQA